MTKQVLEARTRTLGADHPDTLRTMGNLASSLYSLGDHKAAADMKKQVLEAQTRTLGADHPSTLHTMGNLAVSLDSLGDLKAVGGVHMYSSLKVSASHDVFAAALGRCELHATFVARAFKSPNA